jgi:oligoendopeptidase F
MNEKPAEKSPQGAVTIPARSQIPERYKWDPTILFSDIAAWETEVKAVRRALPGLSKHAGHLGESAARAARALDHIFAVRRRLEALSAYAARLLDTDVRQSRPQALSTTAEKLFSEFLSVTAYAEPELLALPEQTLRAYADDPALADYDRYLADLIRLREHVLSTREESILANASVLGVSAYNAYKTFANADLEFPTFTDHEGREVRLSAAMYSRYRQSPHREERRTVFETFWGTYRGYRNTFAQMLAGQLSYYDFTARTRRYPDALTASLKPNAIPPALYDNLIRSVTGHLDAFHRYLRLRKRLLGIRGDQYYYDIYPMPVAEGRRVYTYEQSRTIIHRSMRPLGRAYQRRLKEAMADGSGWIDVFPNQGKRSGAYSSSTYGEHPLVLLNFNNDYDSLSTMAHELGHALHSAYSNEAQPYPKADYALFNAEVASIFNETLLIEYLLKREKNTDERKFLLAAYLDSFRGTVFRQTMFAEFEGVVYRRVKQGKSLTADSLSRLYLRLARKYHGHNEGVMNIQPLYGIEWAFIPHFYYNFYVYQYVTGFIAATALAQRVLEQGSPAAQLYIQELLKAGGAREPMEILRRAGVDMMSAAPYRQAIRQFSDRVRELGRLSKQS